jgi:anti-sigma-K factor RskA
VDAKTLISSGDLELYVLGTLPQAEREAVDALRANSPEVNEEILRIEIAFENYALQNARKVNPTLKNKIASQLIFKEEKKVEAKVVALNTQPWRLAVAASVTIALVSSSAAIYFYNELNSTKNQLQALQQEQVVLANKASYLESVTDSLQEQYSIAANPLLRQIALNGLPFSPNAKAVVYYDNEEGKVFFNPALMPEVGEDKQYQLWAIVEGKPVDLGMIDKNSNAIQAMKAVKNPAAFAITLEPLGGRPTPTMENMCVVGNV